MDKGLSKAWVKGGVVQPGSKGSGKLQPALQTELLFRLWQCFESTDSHFSVLPML